MDMLAECKSVKTMDKNRKSRSVKTRSHRCGESTIYKIGDKAYFSNGERHVKTLIYGRVSDKTKNISLYQVKVGDVMKKKKSSIVFSYDKGLNIYTKSSRGIKRTIKPLLFEILDLRKVSQVRRVAKLINQLLKENNDKRKILLKEITLGNIERTIVELCYPAVKNLSKIPESSYSSILRENIGLREICRKAFGRAGKMTKIVVEHPHALAFGELWRGLIPFERFAEKNYAVDKVANRPNFKSSFRKLVKNFSVVKRSELFKQYHVSMMCRDSVDMFRQIPNTIFPENLKTWDEIHDFLTIEFNRRKTENKNIPYSQKWQKIDNQQAGQFILKLPPDTHTLIAYGQKLNNCIASYGQRAAQGETKLFALYKGDELCYNGEVSNNQIRQLCGKNNKRASEGEYKEIFLFLVENKIVN